VPDTLPPLTGSALLDPWRLRLRHVLEHGEIPRQRGPLPETRSEALLRGALADRPERWTPEYATGRYRLDFYCEELALALEVDGASHWGSCSAAADAVRDAWHAERGIVTHRLSATQVEKDLRGVVQQVQWWVALRRKAISDAAAAGGVPVEALPVEQPAPEHVSQQHVSQEHVSQEHVGQEHVGQEHVDLEHVDPEHHVDLEWPRDQEAHADQQAWPGLQPDHDVLPNSLDEPSPAEPQRVLDWLSTLWQRLRRAA